VGNRRIRKSDWPYVMAAARRKFGEDNPYGVYAYGVHRKITSGQWTRTNALNVYVVHKHDAPDRAVPTLVLRSRGLRIQPDVVGVGAEPKGHDTAQQPPLLGLYPGAAIHAQGRVPQFGGVGCLLSQGAGPTHLLTAGHLFPTNQPKVAVLGAQRGMPPTVVGTLQVNLLDVPYSGMDHPIDVALVALTTDGVRIAQASHDGPRIDDFITSDSLSAIDVSAFLPTAHDCSRSTQTLDGPLDAQMRSPARGVYLVQEVVGTTAVITNPGDSGTILYNGSKASASAVGLCVGQFGAMSIFEPLDRALATLQEGTGLSLSLV
jgi:hypothetical protein